MSTIWKNKESGWRNFQEKKTDSTATSQMWLISTYNVISPTGECSEYNIIITFQRQCKKNEWKFYN